MKNWTMEFRTASVADIKKLPPTTSKRIGIKLRWFAELPNPIAHATKLVGHGQAGEYRYRVGDYRIIFDADEANKIMVVHAVKHRKEVYKNH